jgi:hypothetical protein
MMEKDDKPEPQKLSYHSAIDLKNNVSSRLMEHIMSNQKFADWTVSDVKSLISDVGSMVHLEASYLEF